MNPSVIDALARLQDDAPPPPKATMRWLDAHREDLVVVAVEKGARLTEQLLGLRQNAIADWRASRGVDKSIPYLLPGPRPKVPRATTAAPATAPPPSPNGFAPPQPLATQAPDPTPAASRWPNQNDIEHIRGQRDAYWRVLVLLLTHQEAPS